MRFYLKKANGSIVRNPNETLKAVMHWRYDDLKEAAKDYKGCMV